MLKLPNSSLLSFTYSWEAFPDDDDVWHNVSVHRIVLVFIEIRMWLLVQIVAENGIVVIDELTKMGVHNKRLVGCAEVSFSCQFESDHLELVSGGCSCRVNVEVDILNVDDNEFTQSIS